MKQRENISVCDDYNRWFVEWILLHDDGGEKSHNVAYDELVWPGF